MLKTSMAKKDNPNSFKNFFKEVHRYDDYGYAVNAKDVWEAREKILEYLEFDDWGKDFMNRLKRELRENMKEGWVRFQGYLDDDGEFYNCWVITSEWMGGKPRWFKVWYSDYNQHYVRYGHRFEPKADEEGHRVNYSYNNCDVCNQTHILEHRLKEAEEIIRQKNITMQDMYDTNMESAWSTKHSDLEYKYSEKYNVEFYNE